MTFENCCRICLESTDDILDLEEIYDEEHQLNHRDILELMTNINITEEKDSPMNICCTCGEELQMCYNFQKKVEYSNHILKSIHANNDETETLMSISYVKDDEEEPELLNTESKEIDLSLDDNHISVEQQFTYELVSDMEEDIEVRSSSANKEDMEEMLETETYLNDSSTLLLYKSKASPTQNEQMYSEDTFECKSCYKKFDNEKKLSSHLNSHNPNRRRFKCSGCTRAYVTKQAMETHVLTVHEKKGFKCEFCEKVFAIQKGLVIHMRYHTGDFPYECDQCDRKFAQLCHLKTHVNVKHNNARFTCEYANCNKFFTNSASLRNHEFTHSTMPFICEYCDKGYPAKSKLKVHVRRKHGEEVTIEELERMRVFHVPRTPLKLVELDTTIR